MNSNRAVKIIASSLAVIISIGIGLYALIVWEGSSAREDAPVFEVNVAQWLLHYTVPASFRAMENPLDVGAESADVDAGREIYTKKCEICHAYDGGGKTEIGSGQYPRPPDLRGAESTTTLRPRRSPSGTSAARSAMVPAANMSSTKDGGTSSIRPSSTTCKPMTRASNATRRVSR
jgi:mono/diheme cytochrome c family protein